MDPYKQIYRLLNCEFYKIEVEKFPFRKKISFKNLTTVLPFDVFYKIYNEIIHE